MKLMQQNTAVLLSLPPVKTNVYGVEIEFENYDDQWRWQKGDSRSGSAMWLFDKDDSLRNGCELVSQPLIQTQMRRALECVQNTFDKSSYTVSKRCSIHVHMNLLNLMWGEVWSVAMIYAFLEPEIFAFFGAERQENHFCVPLMHHTKFLSHFKRDATTLRLSAAFIPQVPTKEKAKKIKVGETVSMGGSNVGAQAWHSAAGEQIFGSIEDELPVMSAPRPSGLRFVSETTAVEVGPGLGRGRAYRSLGGGGGQYVRNQVRARLSVPGKAKYCALSAWRMADLGTFEFRLLPSTMNMDNVVQWVKFLGQIKHLAKQYPDPLKLQADYERKGRTWLWKIFGVGAPPYTTDADRDDADEAGFMIAGDPQINQDQMEWKI